MPEWIDKLSKEEEAILKAFVAAIEPAAVSDYLGDQTEVFQTLSLSSIAISLKRIAESLERGDVL